MIKRTWLLFFFGSLIQAVPLLAQPDFTVQYLLDSIVVYRDYQDTTQYYYHASHLQVGTEISGKPNFSFVQSRYTGSQRSGNRGDIRFRSFVQLKVRQFIPDKEFVEQIKIDLKASYGLQEIHLSPLSYKRIAAQMICPRIGKSPLMTEVAYSENMSKSAESSEWKEKVFTLSMDDLTSQALWEALHQGNSFLSLEYRMIAEGKTSVTLSDSAFTVLAPADSANKLEKLKILPDLADESGQLFGEKVVQADAIPIQIDLVKYPDLLKQVDINENVPAEYPLLQVYCFDFENQLSENLLLKKVTLQAWGVNQKRVEATITFRKNQPDAIFQTANFQHAVLVHKPLRYKITTVSSKDGVKESDWKSWHLYDGMLDITLKN